jgi:RND family efflux transporter MFP subunit
MLRFITLSSLLALAFPSQALALKVPFKTTKAIVQTVRNEQQFDGLVDAVQQSTISAQTSGQVVEVLYDVDEFVEKNQLIVRLRDKDQRAQYDRAKATLEETYARLKEAQAEYTRIENIFAQKLVSESKFDNAKAELEAAKARWNAARAALAQAEEQLERTRVRAPYSGIVTKRHVELGESVQQGQPLMSGLSLEKLRVTVAVPQNLITAIRTIGKASVLLGDKDNRIIAANKLTFFPYADNLTHTFDTRIELPQGVNGLFPGMFVKVAFVIGEKQQLVIPSSAVVYRGEVTGVYVVDPEGRVSLRQIRPGNSTGAGFTEVLAGLKEGETIALQPILAGAYLKARH